MQRELDTSPPSDFPTGALSQCAALYDRYARLAYSLAYRVLRDSEAAAEVVHDSFVALCPTIAGGMGDHPEARSQLLATVRRHSLARAATRGPMPAVARPVDGASPPAVLPAGDEQVCAALAGLHPEQRQAIELAFFEGCSPAAIAERFGVQLPAVTGALHEGLHQLRGLLAAADPPASGPAGIP